MENIELTKMEEYIMLVIWEKDEEVTFYNIQEELKARFQKDYKRSTIRTYITSLEKKGLIQLERRGLYTYVTPLQSQSEYQVARLKQMKDMIFHGSTKEMVSALSDIVEENEKKEVQSLIDDFDD